MEQQKRMISREDYIHTDAVSYSALSALASSPVAYVNREFKSPSDIMIFGSLVDTLLTDADNTTKLYYVMTASPPNSEMMLNYVNEMLVSDDHSKAFAASGYKNPISDDKWEKEGKPYYEALKAGKDKTVVSFEVYNKARTVANVLKTNQFTKRFFSSESDSLEIKYQFPIFWKYGDVDCKSLLDVLCIDHKNKIVIPIDLKIVEKSVYSFKRSYVMFHYYLQGSFYHSAVVRYVPQYYPGYRINNFSFIVAEMNSINPPFIYPMSDMDISVGEHGGCFHNQTRVKGFAELIKELKNHKESAQWLYPADVFANNGELLLDTFAESFNC